MSTANDISQQKEDPSVVSSNITKNNITSEVSLETEPKQRPKFWTKMKICVIVMSAIVIVGAIVIVLVVFHSKKKDNKKINNENTIANSQYFSFPETIKENVQLFNQIGNVGGRIATMDSRISGNSRRIVGVGNKIEGVIIPSGPNKDRFGKSKEELEFLNKILGNVAKGVNLFNSEVSSLYNGFSLQGQEFTEKTNEMAKEYESMIVNLSDPFASKSNSTDRRLDLIPKDLLTKYNQTVGVLNSIYNTHLSEAMASSQNLLSSIESINAVSENLTDEIEDTIEKYNSILDNTDPDTIISNIKLIEYLLKNYHGFISRIIAFVDEIKERLKEGNFISLNDIGNILTYLYDIINELKEYCDIDIPYLTSFTQFIYYISELFKYAFPFFERLSYILKYLFTESDIEVYTSLDLLFIAETSASMESYVNQLKKEIPSILNSIQNDCPGIDINVGFIGYRNFDEAYHYINFTSDFDDFKKKLGDIKAFGGGKQSNDVALALELALNSKWESRTRFAVFLADSPAYGKQFDGEPLPSKMPKRRKIEEMIYEMTQKHISLFCLKINEKTDTMFKIFQSIYNTEKPLNTKFILFNPKKTKESFSEIVIEKVVEAYKDEREKKEEDCLVSELDALNILSSKYKINNKSPDVNLRFLLGKCNPVLLVPGLYGTKLRAELNCKGLAEEERDTTLKDIRVFCGSTVCWDESETSEEHPLLIDLGDGPFTILEGLIPLSDKYRACLGHILSYYQNENECEKVDGRKTCYYSKYVKVGYYGGTDNTIEESRCGVEGVINVVQSKNPAFTILVNSLSQGGTYRSLSQNLIYRGYREGFSLGALPNDYRRYLSTNNFNQNVFKYQIERLYNNTGKPVVIVAHSHGTLVTLTNLLINQSDKKFMEKIKKFIALAPPFMGSSKLLEICFLGFKEFNSDFKIIKTNFNIFGEFLWMKSFPTTSELRPLPIASKLFTDPYYSEFADAMRSRLEIENECKEKKCDPSEIEKKTKNFDKLFKGYFPSLLDAECSYEDKIGGNTKTFNRKCYTNIYNIADCATLKIGANPMNGDDANYEKYFCSGKVSDDYYYQGECDGNNGKRCLDSFYYSEHFPYVFSNEKAVNFLIDRFNRDYSEQYGKLTNDYFESREEILKGMKTNIEYQKKISLLNELPVPPIDTDIVYASFIPTVSAMIKNNDDVQIFDKGGDEVVPSWSSLLTGLKWVYDKKKKNLPQKIKLIEYCSRLAKSGKYKYNPDKDQDFAAIGCGCLEDDNVFKDDIHTCTHASLISDNNIKAYLLSVIEDIDEVNKYTDSKKKAAQSYKPEFNYMEQCNKDLYNMLGTEKTVRP